MRQQRQIPWTVDMADYATSHTLTASFIRFQQPAQNVYYSLSFPRDYHHQQSSEKSDCAKDKFQGLYAVSSQDIDDSKKNSDPIIMIKK